MNALTVILAIVLALALLAALSMRRAQAAGKAAEAAAPPLGRFLTIDHRGAPLKLHYVENGPGDGSEAARPTLVMIHGLGGNLRHFTATILDDLARDHRAIAVDRPGMGYSEAPAAGHADLDEQAEILWAALDALGVEKPLLIGHSLGGALALAMALRREPAGLLLLAPATFPFTPAPELGKTVDSAWLRKAIAYTIGPGVARAARPQIMKIVFGPQEEPPEFAVAGGGMLTLRPPQIETTMADGSKILPALAAQSPRYGEIAAPITVLFGDADRMLKPEDHLPPLQEAAPQTQPRLLHGIGHMIPFSATEAAIEAARAMTGAPTPQ